MKNRRISEAVWHRIREDWVASQGTMAALASRHNIGVTSLSRRAKADEWPPRGSGRDDPVALAHRLYADITAELRASLRNLQVEGSEEAPASAGQRGPLIRAHRRALIALLDARKPAAQTTKPAFGKAAEDHASFPALDLDAARQDILARLARLDRSAASRHAAQNPVNQTKIPEARSRL